MTQPRHFTGYRWCGLGDFPKSSEEYIRVQRFIDSIHWDALCQYASKLHHGQSCMIDPLIDMGGVHMIRMITFRDATRWIARLRMRFFDDDDDDEKDAALVKFMEQEEIDTIRLVRDRTSVPVPAIYGHNANFDNDVGAPFILMECLPGNTAEKLNPDVSPQHKASFYADMARIHTEISSIQFSRIGSIIRLEDGTYETGPIPKLGGPFNTATEYFTAWADTMKFGGSMEELQATCGNSSDEIAANIRDFPIRLGSLAANIPIRNEGPFPLCHIDYGHHNIIIDDDYNVLGVIDWEHACTLPWEVVEFPITLGITPAPVSTPMLYDEFKALREANMKQAMSDQKLYVDLVRQAEQSKGMPPLLSAVLDDEAGQDLVAAMRTYVQEGNFGWYCRIFDAHCERWVQNADESKALTPSDDGKGQGKDMTKHPSYLWGILSE